MPRSSYWIGATLAFLAELASLAALAAFGWSLVGSAPLRLLLAVAFPLVAAVLWGLFAAPRAALPHPATAVATMVLVEGGAAGALLALGRPVAAAVLVVAVVLGRLLTARSPGLTPAR